MLGNIDQENLEQIEDTQKGKFLTFNLGNEVYGIEIKYVTEIIGLQPITEIPEIPEYIRGIINLRGKIIPVMDVRIRFQKTFRDYNDRTCVIVVDIGNTAVGLIVDSVAEVLSIPDGEIVPPPEIKGAANKYVQGIGKVGNEVKLLLNCHKLLNEEELKVVESIEQEGGLSNEVVL